MTLVDEMINTDISGLWNKYQECKTVELRDKLIIHYLQMVKIVASRLAIGLPHYVDKDDLMSNGFFGLIDAIERYDIQRGVKFETYAAVRIRGAILDALRAQDWIPMTVRQKARHYEQVLAKLENKLGHSATDQEIIAELGLSMDQYNHLLAQLHATTTVPLEDFIKTETPSNKLFNPAQAVEEADIKTSLAKSIDRLPEKERLVVSLYYYEELTLKEISMIMSLSEARISQLHTKAIFRMRGALSGLKSSLL
ncbi:RNA polymerase sigma factor for flagellar operon FliA [Sporomusaceae bacterium BoRhaA]|jgi:RNA polymerase sigma factor FliA|uniref:FliA/WhiG family RNA polymerase sigma factor n=1 Tax=Pelorhabdus rhamnosifermentans TaxID=2772457 RepID=UPI001C05FA58|nr:FliA/WhiG family RNA polymerase sigma factor [Pelorhabdus rhamnosifermentans]MBU2701985.1 RNA polymerase sigma factor for flagellar operon FliA [Pelorhabdus rhamnosifermentans]